MPGYELLAVAERLRAKLGRLEATTVREAAFYLGLKLHDGRRNWRAVEAALLLAGFEPCGNGRWVTTGAGVASLRGLSTARIEQDGAAERPADDAE